MSDARTQSSDGVNVPITGVPVDLRGVSRVYGSGPRQVQALAELDLSVKAGEFLTLLGPSGSGKTTALQIITGLLEPSSGEVLLGGQSVTRLAPHKRDIGVVFQGYALFPHMSVAQNVGFPLRLRKTARAEIRRLVDEALRLVQLEALADRMPAQLSGGQRQRVAIARALVFSPRVLLMDEPLGALDRKLRDRLQLELRELQKRVGITCIYVTHDQEEAMLMSDRIAILAEGRLQQLGTAEEIYHRPANAFVGDFIGRMNFWPGRVVAIDSGGTIVELGAGARVRSSARVGAPGAPVRVAIRPEALSVRRDPPGDGLSGVEVEIKAVRFTGSVTLVQATVAPGVEALVQAGSGELLSEDRRAWLVFDPTAALVFAEQAPEASDPASTNEENRHA